MTTQTKLWNYTTGDDKDETDSTRSIFSIRTINGDVLCEKNAILYVLLPTYMKRGRRGLMTKLAQKDPRFEMDLNVQIAGDKQNAVNRFMTSITSNTTKDTYCYYVHGNGGVKSLITMDGVKTLMESVRLHLIKIKRMTDDYNDRVEEVNKCLDIIQNRRKEIPPKEECKPLRDRIVCPKRRIPQVAVNPDELTLEGPTKRRRVGPKGRKHVALSIHDLLDAATLQDNTNEDDATLGGLWTSVPLHCKQDDDYIDTEGAGILLPDMVMSSPGMHISTMLNPVAFVSDAISIGIV